MGDGILLVMGSGDRQYREYLIAAAAQRHPLWLLDPDPPSWQSRYVVGSTVADVFDPETATAAALELAERIPIRGVFCYHEAVIGSAAHVTATLGLPGTSPAAVRACRDKN